MLTRCSTTPIHTGEQIYLRQNFKELIEQQAVHVVGPDPADVGGIAELKWIAEYADLHGIVMAPHGTANGLLGLGALVQVPATLPNGMIAVSDRPGMGVDLVPDRARPYLAEDDKTFFDEVPAGKR